MSSCIFCKIVASQAPAYKVYEDDKVVAFLDAKPFADGHTLIIPKQHYQDILDIPEDCIESVARAAKNLARTYKLFCIQTGSIFVNLAVQLLIKTSFIITCTLFRAIKMTGSNCVDLGRQRE